MFQLKPKYRILFCVCWENFALYHNKRLLRADPCCRSVIKEFAHAFSCAYIELWMYLRSLESTQKARVALGCASSYSYAFFVLSKLSACIRGYTHAKREQILNVRAFACACIHNNITRTKHFQPGFGFCCKFMFVDPIKKYSVSYLHFLGQS